MAGGTAIFFRVVSDAIASSPLCHFVDKSGLRTGHLSERPVFSPVAVDQCELLNERIGLKSTTENLAVLLTVYKRSVYRLVDGQ